jgi:single-stranded-DNA-specific exonuclease
VKDQAHLLHRFGGHPFAAGLSLPVENIPLFTEAINQRLRQQCGELITLAMQVDLVCTVRDLGKDLFWELKLLEPCGMGNPVPKLLIQNCWFENAWHRNQQDWQGKKVQYIKTEFDIRDDSTGSRFAGVWWGHYKDELPLGRCDCVAELDYNTYKKRYEIRLVAVRTCTQNAPLGTASTQVDWILDWRRGGELGELGENLLVEECPTSWDDLQAWFRRSLYMKQKLAIAWSEPQPVPPNQIWLSLVGIAKYLSRTDQTVTRLQIHQKLGIGDQSLQLGFQALTHLGFQVSFQDRCFRISATELVKPTVSDTDCLLAIEKFRLAVREEQFQRQYFYEVPLSTIQAMAAQTASGQFNEF